MFEVFNNLNFFNNPNFNWLFMSNYISEPNKHIEEYLNYYCENQLSNYAVLINGKWGVGKTWFISKLEEELRGKHKNVIYISLNGIAKKEAIDDEIFRFLHPFWTDKKVKFLGRVASGLVKATLKFDIDGDGKSDGSTNVSIPSVNIDDLLKKGENLILIFDDVERCQIPISELLGYINYFVEHTKSKVILIGNEEEIVNKDKNKNYFPEKEKIIGTTFLFNGDVSSAFDSIVEEILDIEFRNEVIKVKEDLLSVYSLSKYENIRILKQSIHGFKRFFDARLCKGDEELFKNLFINYLIFSIENKKNSFNGEILKFNTNEEEKLYYSRYSLSKYSRYIIDNSIWTDIIINNIINKELISNNLQNNYFSYLDEKPEWYKLWHYYDLNNTDFLNLLNSAVSKLDLMEYNEIGEVFHVVCAVFYFNQNFVTPFDSNNVKDKGFKNIDFICSKMGRSDLDNYIRFEDKTNWGGYSYLGYDLEIIKSFINEGIEKIKEFKKSRIQEEAKELFQLLATDSRLFLHRICLTNSAENIYFNVPILKEISPKIFAKALVDLDWNTVKRVLSALETRYNVDKKIIEDIFIEKEWVEDVLKNLTKLANERTSIEKFRIDNILIKKINYILCEFLN